MLENLLLYLTILGSMVGIFTTYHRVISQNKTNSFKQFEMFIQLKNLWETDQNKNLPEVKVGFECFAKRRLLAKEIEWFLCYPGAFSYLKKFGELNRYVDVDFVENSFKFKSRFDSKQKRIMESVKINFIYFVSGTAGLSLVSFVPLLDGGGDLSVFGGLHLVGYFLLFIATIFFYVSFMLVDAKTLVRAKLC